MDRITTLIEQESKAIQAIPRDGGMEEAVAAIHKAVHLNKGKLVISGVGKAGHIGIKMATTFCSTGTPTCFLDPLDAQHGDLGLITENDLLFVISNSGRTREVIELVHLCRQIHNKMDVVVMTRNTDSPLAKEADVVVATGLTEEICPLGLTPTVSTTVMSVIGDVMTVLLMEKIGFTKEDYALRHHSGYLGQKAKTT